MLFYLHALQSSRPPHKQKKDTFSPPNCFEEFILANDDSLLAKSMLFYLYANM